MTITTHRPSQTSHQPRTHTIDKEVTAMETFDLFALLDAVGSAPPGHRRPRQIPSMSSALSGSGADIRARRPARWITR